MQNMNFIANKNIIEHINLLFRIHQVHQFNIQKIFHRMQIEALLLTRQHHHQQGCLLS